MSSSEDASLTDVFGSHNVFLQKNFPAGTLTCIFASFFYRIPRQHFQNRHFRYDPVPERYLLSNEFDNFCPPLPYLSRLGTEPLEDIELFLEALGCFVELDQQQRAALNSKLKIPVPPPKPQQRQGVVLICWDRIEKAAGRLDIKDVLHLLLAIAFHQHSHAARAAPARRPLHGYISAGGRGSREPRRALS